MTEQSREYLNRLYELYKQYDDNTSLLDLADVEQMEERARELEVYREQPKTQELLRGAIERYRNCLEKLTNPVICLAMTESERAYCFATMDWAKFTLDAVGEDPSRLRNEVDKMILGYAQKAGIST